MAANPAGECRRGEEEDDDHVTSEEQEDDVGTECAVGCGVSCGVEVLSSLQSERLVSGSRFSLTSFGGMRISALACCHSASTSSGRVGRATSSASSPSSFLTFLAEPRSLDAPLSPLVPHDTSWRLQKA